MAAPDAIERSLCSASIDGGKRSLWVMNDRFAASTQISDSPPKATELLGYGK
jgi:hypothetical protein